MKLSSFFISKKDKNSNSEEKHNPIRDDTTSLKKDLTIGSIIAFVGLVLFFLSKILFTPEIPLQINSSSLNKDYNNKLIYLNSRINEELVKDNVFKFSHKAIMAKRIVEKYQWKNENDKFIKTWSSEYIDNSSYNKSEYVNPKMNYFYSKELNKNKELHVGVFKIPDQFKNTFLKFTKINYSKEFFQNLSESGQKAFKIFNGMLYYSQTPGSPKIGDFRIYYEVINSTSISILAKQNGKNLLPYGSDGVFVLKPGNHSLESLSKIANLSSGSTLLYISYIISFLIIIAGIWFSTKNILTNIKGKFKSKKVTKPKPTQEKNEDTESFFEESFSNEDDFSNESDFSNDTSLSNKDSNVTEEFPSTVDILEDDDLNNNLTENEDVSLTADNIENLLTQEPNEALSSDTNYNVDDSELSSDNSLSFDIDEPLESSSNEIINEDLTNIDLTSLQNNDLSNELENNNLLGDSLEPTNALDNNPTKELNIEEGDFSFTNTEEEGEDIPEYIDDNEEEGDDIPEYVDDNEEETNSRKKPYIKWPSPNDVL